MSNVKCPLLALDLGDRFIGLAYSEVGILATEIQTIDRRGKLDSQIFSQIEKIIKEREIKTLVVGLPISADGSENPRCQKIRTFINNFENSTFYFPEDFSSIDASLLPKLKLHQKTKTSSHSQAARIILERFLEEMNN